MERGELQAIYVMWLRQMKNFIRSKSRIVGTIAQPLFFLFILGWGFRGAVLPGVAGNYIQYIGPGFVAMAILFSAIYTGVSVLWDKKFGFLQEILVAPVSRLTIVIGRTLGGATTALIQGLFVLIVSIVLGVTVASISGFILALIFMILIGVTSVGFGLILASKMDDFEGFRIVITLIIMPLFFTSSAVFSITTKTFPDFVVKLSYVNPLFYMVDGLRGSLTDTNYIINPFLNLGIVIIICSIIFGLGIYFFNKTEI
jgi:ABC-2 type transport system permease protein